MDVGILIAGISASVLLARFDERFGMVLLFVLTHFFLFCNVLRMSRSYELLWAVLFVLLAGSTFYFSFPLMHYTLSVMLVVTVTLSTVQIMQPSYHGVLWRQVNPNLKQWWDANEGRRP